LSVNREPARCATGTLVAGHPFGSRFTPNGSRTQGLDTTAPHYPLSPTLRNARPPSPMIDLSAFAALPDSAAVRVVPVAGDLAADGMAFLGVVEALLDRWKERGVALDAAVAFAANRRFLLVAWVPA